MTFTKSVIFIVLTVVLGSHSLHPIWDERFQDEWKGTCASGLLQTPIAIPSISERNLTEFMRLEFTNMKVPINQVTVTNLGRHTLFEWERDGSAQYPQRYFKLKTSQDVAPFRKGKKYVLQNVHVHHNLNAHTGTLHAIDGWKYAMEMQLLFLLPEFDHDYLGAFESGPGNALEMSILWRLSDKHNAAWSLLNDLTLSQKLSENQTITSSGETSFRLSDFIPKNTQFVLYPGSMCYNNCLETNTWIVFDEPMDFDTADLGMRHWTYISGGVEIPLHRNIRHVQSRNGRPVYHAIEQQVMFKDPSCRV